MLLSIFSLTRRFTLPLVFSLCVHILLIAALCYFSASRFLVKPVMTGADAEITIVDIATFAALSSGHLSAFSQSEHLEKPLTEPVVEKKASHLAEARRPTRAAPEPVRRHKREDVSGTIKKAVKDDNKPVAKKMASSMGPLSLSEKSSHWSEKSTPPAISPRNLGIPEPKALVKVKPDYPQRALALHIEGWVKVQYDIDEAGRVINIRVLEAEPRNLFERDVRQAMKKWRFEAVAARDYVTTVIFKLEGGR